MTDNSYRDDYYHNAVAAYGSAVDELVRLHAMNAKLLAALKGAADWIESTADEEDDAAGAWAYVHNLRTLIAKAEGRS